MHVWRFVQLDERLFSYSNVRALMADG